MKKYIYLFVFSILACHSYDLQAQGCVAVKNMSTCSMNFGERSQGFQLSLNYRYFRSYKHFVGSHEETHRVEQGTQVINNDNSINVGVGYTFNNRWSASLIIPYIFIDRSSMYEHLGNSSGQRFHTQSNGLGDIRLIGYYNALGTDYHNGTLTLGFGLKAPTGKYDVTDFFHKSEGLVENVVDQSIQLGDGGLGIITELDFNHNITGNLNGYATAMYMFNPKNTNGVKRSENLTGNIPRSNEFSVTDQYMVRLGALYHADAFQFSLGGRMECIPSKDLVGDSDGFRRPGYIISAEPSAYYTTGQHTFGFNFPIALVRNRTRSQIDIARGINPNTLEPYHGDAAFADWLLSVTYVYRLPGS